MLKTEQLNHLFKAAEGQFDEMQAQKAFNIDTFQEDWQLSQFWYADETADVFADELLDGADQDTVIAVVSAPSVYARIKQRSNLPTDQIYLLEYDTRFKLLAGEDYFSFYDYKQPLQIPQHLKGKCHRIIIDPPYLQTDCQTKCSLTARALLSGDKTSKTENGVLKYKLISCTGERMSKLMSKVYPDSKITTFEPEHKNGLSNEFRCYATFECSRWKFV